MDTISADSEEKARPTPTEQESGDSRAPHKTADKDMCTEDTLVPKASAIINNPGKY